MDAGTDPEDDSSRFEKPGKDSGAGGPEEIENSFEGAEFRETGPGGTSSGELEPDAGLSDRSATGMSLEAFQRAYDIVLRLHGALDSESVVREGLKLYSYGKKYFPNQHRELLTLSRVLASNYELQEDYPRARIWNEEAIAIAETSLGEKKPLHAELLETQGRLLLKNGNYKASLAALDKAELIKNQLTNAEPLDQFKFSLLRACAYIAAGDQLKGASAFDEVRTQLEKTNQSQASDALRLIAGAGKILLTSREFLKAEELFTAGLSYLRRKGHCDLSVFSELSYRRAQAMSFLGKQDGALESIEEAIDAQTMLGLQDRLKVADFYFFKASLVENSGQGNRAGQLYVACAHEAGDIFVNTGETKVLPLLFESVENAISCGFPKTQVRDLYDLLTDLTEMVDEEDGLASLLYLAGRLSAEWIDSQSATSHFAEAVRLVDKSPATLNLEAKGILFLKASEAYLAIEELDSARELLNRSFAIFNQLENPISGQCHPFLALCWRQNGFEAIYRKDMIEARNSFGEAAKIFDQQQNICLTEYEAADKAVLLHAKANFHALNYALTEDDRKDDADLKAYSDCLRQSCDVLFSAGLTAHPLFFNYHKELCSHLEKIGMNDEKERIELRVHMAQFELG